MRTASCFFGAMALLLVSTSWRAAEMAAGEEKTRNPFGVKDVADPDGKDVQEFAATVKLAGDANDPNAEQWVKEATPGKKDSLNGQWFDRWNTGGGDWNYGKAGTQLKVVGERVYILVNCSNGQFLVDLKRDTNRLVGRYQGVDNPSDTGPVVLVIVDNERLDGNWAGQGRWDFRRKLKEK